MVFTSLDVLAVLGIIVLNQDRSLRKAKTVKNRVHLDVWLPGREIQPLGARVLGAPDEDIDRWVPADLEGNEFCAFPARS